MRTHMLARRGALILSATATALWSVSAFADGGFFGKGGWSTRVPVSSPGQKAIIASDGPSHELLILQTTYRGPSAEFAWVIPVPGIPSRNDVFLANPDLLPELEAATRPRERTTIIDPLISASLPWLHGVGPPGMPGAAGLGGPGLPSPQVIVHERMQVGDYDIAVLSATGHRVLVEWLNRNGYEFRRDAEPIVDGYVTRKWYFVALRVLPKLVVSQPTLVDVKPLGIRFPTKELVYPLTISQVSARGVTTLLLFVLSDKPMECSQLPVVTFPARMRGKRGSTYRSLARQLLAKQAGKALLCETRNTLHYEQIHWRHQSGSAGDAEGTGMVYGSLGPTMPPSGMGRSVPTYRLLKVARLWAELPRDALRDLSFTAADRSSFTLRVERSATLPTPLWAYLLGSKIAVVVWCIAAVSFVVWFLCPSKGTGIEDQAVLVMDQMWRWVLLFAILWAMNCWIRPWDSISWYSLQERFRDQFSRWSILGTVSASLSAQLLLALWLPLGLLLGRNASRKVSRTIVFLSLAPFLILFVSSIALMATMTSRLALSYTDHFGVGIVLPVLATLGLAPLCWLTAVALVCAGTLLTRRRQLVRALCLVAPILPLIIPVVSGLCGTIAHVGRPNRYEAESHQRNSLQRMETALKMFNEATGAYPRKLQDLTSRTLPSEGLDSSGNPVKLAGQPTMPLLPELPTDPLTGRNDTWIYDVRSSFLVESGSHELTVFTDSPNSPTW